MRAFVRAVVAVLVLIAALPAGAAAATCPDGRDGPGWTLSTTTFDNHYTRHAYVGNGYLSQRVPPAGTGYMATGEKTGWPLYTPRYDGAFVGGLYGVDPSSRRGRGCKDDRCCHSHVVDTERKSRLRHVLLHDAGGSYLELPPSVVPRLRAPPHLAHVDHG